jgi:hypothetical protein
MNVRAGKLIFALSLLALPSLGCGSSTTVAGRVTCNGAPVKGSVLFSPFGEGEDNTGPAVGAPLKDGNYEIRLQTVGKHRVVVSPSDIKYPAPPGQEYPCSLAAQIKEIKAGANKIDIELTKRP